MKQPIEQNDASEPRNTNKGPKNTPPPGPAPGKSAADAKREEADRHGESVNRNEGAAHVGETGESGEPVAQDSVTVEPHPVRQPSGQGPGAFADTATASVSEPDYYQLDYLKRAGDRLPWERHTEHWPTQAEAEERRAGFDKDHASVRITRRYWNW